MITLKLYLISEHAYEQGLSNLVGPLALMPIHLAG
mgnify:FL=1